MCGDIKKMALGVLDLFQVGIAGHGFDPIRQGSDLIVAGHHSDAAELQALGMMHGADGNSAWLDQGRFSQLGYSRPSPLSSNQWRLNGSVRGKPHRTTIPDKKAPCPLDKVNRQFRGPAPNMLWVSDFTYVANWKGFACVAFVIDA